MAPFESTFLKIPAIPICVPNARRAGRSPAEDDVVHGGVFGEPPRRGDEALHDVVGQLRRKIEPDPAHPRYIVTEPGMGYRREDA